MLNDRGYDITPYKNMTGSDILKLMPDIKNPGGLMMEVKHRTNPERRAVVLYTDGRIKQTTGPYIEKIIESEEETPERIPNTEYVIITLPTEEIGDTFDKAALDAWTKHKMRIQFFNMGRMVNNLMKHYTQPKFELVSPENHKELVESEWYCRSKTQFPLIRFHNDPVARYMGLVPGDIIKITRTSYSAGEYILYRTCV
jgi:DNA-directed RNA polymerase subunit H (RpoH/RPB5)